MMSAMYTQNNQSRKKKKKSEKQIKLEKDQENWLRKNYNLSSEELKKNSKNYKIEITKKYEGDNLKTSDCICDGGRDNSLMNNLQNESESTKAAIMRKASLVAPLYNKGPLQVITAETDITKIGQLSRR